MNVKVKFVNTFQYSDEPWSIKRLYPEAKLPTKAHDTDLGYDLYACLLHNIESVSLSAGCRTLISAGIAGCFPGGLGGLIRDRSSVATKQGLLVIAGVIDNGYTGEIKVALYNSTNKDIEILHGDKIAQLILVPVINSEIEEVDELGVTDRGAAGFGSTGQ